MQFGERGGAATESVMLRVRALLVLAATALHWDSSGANVLPLVGFFHSENSEEEEVFKLTIKRLVLPNATLHPIIEHLSEFDSFSASNRICNATEEGIGALLGSHSRAAVGVMRSLSSSLEVPLMETHWDPEVSSTQFHDFHPFTLNLYPDPKLLGKALVAVIEDMNWDSFSIIYEDMDSLVKLQELLKTHSGYLTPDGHVPFTVWQLGEDGDYRPMLKELHASSESRIVLDCSVEKILPVLHQAKEVNLMGDYNTYLITSLDAHTLDYGEFKYGRTNITALRLVDPKRFAVQRAVYDWNNPLQAYPINEPTKPKRGKNITAETVKTESALIYDAVQLYAKALSTLDRNVSVEPLTCGSADYWRHGFAIFNQMKHLSLEGMSGRMEFDELGRRTFFTVEITMLTPSGFRKIGSWDPKNGMNYTRTKSEMESEIFQSISNKTFIVVSRLGKPYLKIREDQYEGNDRFEGYSKDLIDEIAKDLGFKYKFVLAPDGQYGTLDKKTKQWNGLIKELREKRADLAICDLTITYDRRSAVDFTMPFMTLGISILYSKPVKQPPNLFSFLSPFSLAVWIYMATALLGVSLVLYITSRLSPNEWESPHPCNPDHEELECSFSMYNCLWFSIGSLTGAGCDILPKSISTRLLAGVWWFFVLIMISSYTANLTAFLTMERMEETIKNVEDLAKQNKIKYGVLQGGSSQDFFRESNDSTYQKIWSVMEATRPTVFVKNNDEGVERVLKGKRAYAYFMESTSIEYQIEQHCELTQVGGLLDSKGYGIAMPFNSPYRTAISGSVLKMQESGKLTELKNKWWKEMSGHRCKATKHEHVASNELGISNVGGVFLVLIIGCSLGFFVTILEFLWNVRKVAVQEKISLKEAFFLELSFALQCSESLKPVHWTKQENEMGSFMQLNTFHHYSLDCNAE